MTAQLVDQPNVAWATRAQVLAIPWFSSLSVAPAIDPALLDSLIWVSSTWLWRASGRQFPGPASTTVRPVDQCGGGYGIGHGNLADSFNSRGGTYGSWGNQGRGEGAHEILLGHTPVRSVDQVVINGSIFAATASDGAPNYRLDDARWLVRCDGNAWPAWQDWGHESGLAASGDKSNTWEVTLTWGDDPPPDGIYASQILAGELALAANQSGQCRLPRNVQSVTRQGTSMVMLDPSALIDGNRWGIPEIDFFVMSANPNGLLQPATMTSPDIGRAVRRAGTLPGS